MKIVEDCILRVYFNTVLPVHENLFAYRLSSVFEYPFFSF